MLDFHLKMKKWFISTFRFSEYHAKRHSERKNSKSAKKKELELNGWVIDKGPMTKKKKWRNRYKIALNFYLKKWI